MSDAQSVRERVADLFSNVLNRDVPSVDVDLFDTGILDSLLFVELLLHLEQEFGIKTAVNDLEVDNFRSIACIAEIVVARTPGQARRPAVAR